MPDLTASLSSGFPAPGRADWVRLVERSLKGEPLESLLSRTADGLEIEPLYTAEDAPPGRLLSRTASFDAARAWDIRTPVSQPTPAKANLQILEDLAGGACSVLLRIDPDGGTGCAIGSAEDMAGALDGLVLEAAGVALDAGFHGPEASAWLDLSAKASPTACIDFGLDPLSAFAQAGSSPGPIEDHLTAAAEDAARLAGVYPKASLFLASGRAVHEAGGSEAQELAFMAAAALAYARAAEAAGLTPAQCLPRILLGISVDADIFVSVAKLRAARLIVERIAQACGAGPASARVEARSSRRMLTRLDPWTNMLRLTCAGFAAAVGGADAIALDAFTDAIGRPTAFARRQARNIQLVLMEESHLGRVDDPSAGSWFVETLTQDLAREAWSVFQAIERQGGVLGALRSGWIAANLEGPRRALLSAAEHRGILGVNRYPNANERPVEVEGSWAPDSRTARPTAGVAPSKGGPGAGSACPPLTPVRISEGLENLDGALV